MKKLMSTDDLARDVRFRRTPLPLDFLIAAARCPQRR